MAEEFEDGDASCEGTPERVTVDQLDDRLEQIVAVVPEGQRERLRELLDELLGDRQHEDP